MLENLNVEVGARIKATREERLDISREELARRVGVSRPSIANIEEGRQNITIVQLFEFAEILGISALDLLPDMSSTTPKNLSKVLPKDIAADIRAWVDKL